MSGRKKTPRTMLTDFIGSEAPEQSALRPTRRRASRNMSGPAETAKSTRQKSKLGTEGKRSLHLSMMDDKTPRTMVSDFLHDTRTTEPTRKRTQLERSPPEPSRKSPRLNTTEPVLRRSPRGGAPQSSPRRRRSINTSLLKKTVVRNFINSPKQMKLKDDTPRTMVNNFLMGDTPAQTPLMAQHQVVKPTPNTTQNLHQSSTSFDINVSPTDESLLGWQQKYQRPPLPAGKSRSDQTGHQGASMQEKLSQFSQHLSQEDNDDEDAEDSEQEPSEQPAEGADVTGNRSNLSANQSSLSVLSSGDIDGSYLSMPSSQLSQRSTQRNRSRAVQEITSAAIQQEIGDLIDQTSGEDISKIMQTLEQIDEGEEEEEEGDERTLQEEEQKQKHAAESRRELLADRSQTIPSGSQDSDTSKWQFETEGGENIDGDREENEAAERHVDVGDNEDEHVENSREEEEEEAEGVVEHGQEEDKENEEIVPPSDNEIYSDEEIPVNLQANSANPAEFVKDVSSAQSPAQEGNRTGFSEQVTPQMGSTSQMSTPGSAAHTPSVIEGYDRLRTPMAPLVQTKLAFKGRSLTAAFPTPTATASTSQQPPGAANQAKKPRAPRKPKDKDAPIRIPTVNTRSIFTHFCGMKVSKDAIAEIEKVADKYWDRAADDLFAFAEHAKRKNTISEEDVELLMKRQGFVTDKCSMYSLVEKYLSLEQRQEIIPCARANGKTYPPN